jgi:hypothetical protein
MEACDRVNVTNCVSIFSTAQVQGGVKNLLAKLAKIGFISIIFDAEQKD